MPRYMLKHDLPFDPTCGYDREALLKVGAPEAPEDFEAFWRDTYEQTRAVPTNPSFRAIDGNAQYDAFEVEYDGLGGFRVGGWLVQPKDGVVERGVVMGHGYGGREMPEMAAGMRRTAIIQPCGRGFHRSAGGGYPGSGALHVLHGIESRETYSHRFCVADFWSAATVLLDRFPSIEGRLNYVGGSFGGGLGAMVLPWDDRFARAQLRVPSFGNHPLRVTLPSTGTGEAVRLMHQRRPEVLDVLKYFDAAIHARLIRQPTLVGCALFDPAVPPPGQFAVYNAIAAEKRLFILTAGHFNYPEEAAEGAELMCQRDQWLGVA